jgi:hypothetical protein
MQVSCVTVATAKMERGKLGMVGGGRGMRMSRITSGDRENGWAMGVVGTTSPWKIARMNEKKMEEGKKPRGWVGDGRGMHLLCVAVGDSENGGR